MGKPSEAEAENRRALEIFAKLAADHPAVTDFRSHLAGSHNDLANVLSTDGQADGGGGRVPPGAGDLPEKLAADNPAVTEFRSRLANSHHNLGLLLWATGKADGGGGRVPPGAGDPPEAGRRQPEGPRPPQRAGLVPHQPLRRTPPAGPARRGPRRLRPGHRAPRGAGPGGPEGPDVPQRPGLELPPPRPGPRRPGRPAPAPRPTPAGRFALWEGLPSRTGEEWFETACARAALAGLAGRDGAGVSAAEGKAEADQAMALLRKAVAMGYRDAGAFRTDSALDPLRQREDFKKLLVELEQRSAARPK